jgi:hypothetical protein
VLGLLLLGSEEVGEERMFSERLRLWSIVGELSMICLDMRCVKDEMLYDDRLKTEDAPTRSAVRAPKVEA